MEIILTTLIDVVIMVTKRGFVFRQIQFAILLAAVNVVTVNATQWKRLLM
jgi:hypothetical protein